MRTRSLTHAQQLPLDPALEEELVQKKAREIYTQSRLLSAKYASFARLMEDPVAGRCLRLCATQLLRRGNAELTGAPLGAPGARRPFARPVE